MEHRDGPPRILYPQGVNEPLQVIDLGRMAYAEALEVQRAHLEEIIAAREAGGTEGRLLLVEHDPVVTVSKRAKAPQHVVASTDQFERAGVAIEPTDRGGDVTYHGPGQLVAYPIVDLNAYGLNLHAYMRLLEQTVIDALAGFGLEGWRDDKATGVWVGDKPGSKIAAMGVRVRRWVSMHGLALNVDPEMAHYDLIVPCGLAGRTVTSLRRELGEARPSMAEAKAAVASSLQALLDERRPIRERG